MRSGSIESIVRKWFVFSVLAGRYSASPETQFDYDIRRIDEYGTETYRDAVIQSELSDAFWENRLPQQLNTYIASSSVFNVFLAAQVMMQDKGFLSSYITVYDLITQKGDIHHIFPKDYLKSNGSTKDRYNQIANYVIMQSEANISIGKKPPKQYLEAIRNQCNDGELKYGGITSNIPKNTKIF